MKWSDRRLLDLFGIDHPIIQAPMAGASSAQMAIAVSQAGGLGSIAAAMLTAEALRTELQIVQQGTGRSINVNFFVHEPPAADAAREAGWRRRLEPYYRELGLPADAGAGGPVRAPFDAALCDVVLEFKPKVASFHFGMPDAALVKRLKAEKIVVISSATTAAEARWLEAHGCDAVIAQGAEAGGHRGMFLTDNIAEQPGTFALVPQVVDAVKVPVIAAGGIADGRGIAAAFALGASGVQLGTRFVCAHESIAHAQFKRAFIRASARDAVASVQLDARFPVIPVRALANPATDRFREIQRQLIDRFNSGELSQKDAQLEIEHFWAGALRRAVIDGDVEAGSLMAGQSVGLVTREQSTADILAELVGQALMAIAGRDQRLTSALTGSAEGQGAGG